MIVAYEGLAVAKIGMLRRIQNSAEVYKDMHPIQNLAARVRNYASRGRESANYGGAILLGLTALEWEEGAQHSTVWRFVTL